MERLVGRRITRATADRAGQEPILNGELRLRQDGGQLWSVEDAADKAPYIRNALQKWQAAVGELAPKMGETEINTQKEPENSKRSLGLDGDTRQTVDETQWPPRFTKLELEFDQGPPLAFCDPRRFGRLRLRGAGPLAEPPLNALAADFLAPPPVETFAALGRTKAPVKAILLDQQKLVAGVGNWVVDEVLFHAGITSAPCDTLSPAQVGALRTSLVGVARAAVQANADSEKFPAGWLFHHRWRNQTSGTFSSPIGVIKFDTVGGRTTAWLPSAPKGGRGGQAAAAAASAAAGRRRSPPSARRSRRRRPRRRGGAGGGPWSASPSAALTSVRSHAPRARQKLRKAGADSLWRSVTSSVAISPLPKMLYKAVAAQPPVPALPASRTRCSPPHSHP